MANDASQFIALVEKTKTISYTLNMSPTNSLYPAIEAAI